MRFGRGKVWAGLEWVDLCAVDCGGRLFARLGVGEC